MVEPGALDVLKAVGGSSLFYLKTWRQRNFADLRADLQLREIIDLYLKWHLPEEYWTGMDHIKTISAKVFNDDKAARLSVNEVRKKAKWFQMHFLGALPDEFLMELQAVDRRPRTGVFRGRDQINRSGKGEGQAIPGVAQENRGHARFLE
ncbi:uncharacterized protein PGTG_15348 [Puccinia graminis f. sp. tritici CRL 75-36-700-3]|uniref:Uncharacterized protein n=1 Tax=Puccinia graminis f. sp. tritici (strain CRL 75-36-700-3 / race SCCL) TaxID=418459 RepID=E3KYW0_PUCGT|nr:uncharacterized protein PGTG_15348 [Puccinia graminis f. sp. tritici CRL 75-36-700-3]EFP89506.1 hypothetical protein PGTG_15348 [Puccinia graminis f. sp. tritici CRL 75-36-700-3]